MSWPDGIQTVLEQARPLTSPRGRRLPLYLWPAMSPGPLSPERAEDLVRELDRRGVGLVCPWDPDRREGSLREALTVARAQGKLGLGIAIDATACLASYFDGSPATAHVRDSGKLFFDTSFGHPEMGCPFALDHRRPAIRERVEWFAGAYARERLAPRFVFADWEIDGPLEWNGAWDASRECRRCRERVPDLENFLAFQKAIRDLRADLQREDYAEPILRRFPRALVGNYAVYPNDGFRYWYDYFEHESPVLPGIREGYTLHRHWAAEWERSGYTFAMPVVYPWERLFYWTDAEPADFRWFRNMLFVGSNACRHTPRGVPIVAFVHFHMIPYFEQTDASPPQMSERAYRELLWHLLLRGVATFFLWCTEEENAVEVRLLHGVWAEAQQWGAFLERGQPITFDVPEQPVPVVSGLRLGDRVLVRRTDFGDERDDVYVSVRGVTLRVPRLEGECAVLRLPRR